MQFGNLSPIIEISSSPGFPAFHSDNWAHMVLAKNEKSVFYGLYWQDFWDVQAGDVTDLEESRFRLQELLLGGMKHDHFLPKYFDEEAFSQKAEACLGKNSEFPLEELMIIRQISDQERARSLVGGLDSLSLPVFPKGGYRVCDGSYVKVKIYAEGGELEFSYHSMPPDSWKPVDNVYDDVWELVMEQSISDDEDEEEED